MKRNERISFIVQKLTEFPNRLFSLNYFSDELDAAKSSVSEDLLIIKSLFQKKGMGTVETVVGASGGVYLKPVMPDHEEKKVLLEIETLLADDSRRILDEYIYYGDILYNPQLTKPLGNIIARRFADRKIDVVMTIETKGVALAMMTAYCLNVPLVVARKSNRISDGTTISVHYKTNTSKSIQNMYATKKSIAEGSNVLIVDDFLRGGGTLKGMINLVSEFGANVVGSAVFMEAKDTEKVHLDHISLFGLEKDGENIKISINNEL